MNSTTTTTSSTRSTRTSTRSGRAASKVRFYPVVENYFLRT